MGMQRVFAVVLLLTLAAVPLSAQRHSGGGGGGHVGMRGPGVSFGGSVGHAGGYHDGSRYSVGVGVSVGAAHFGGHYYAPRYYGPHYSYGGYYGPRYYWPRYNWGFSFYYGYPYAAYSYAPYYSYPYPYTYYAAPSYPVAYTSDSNSNYQATQQLSQDVNELKSEVRDLRDTNDQLRYEINKRATPQQPQSYAYPRPPVSDAVPRENEAPPTLLVFKDGRRIEANNYAVVGQTVWILNSQQAQKYPLAQLDVEESRRLNAERGIEFTVPNK